MEFDTNNIKPIPKYILKRIKSLDSEPARYKPKTRYYAYYTKIKNELCEITCAVRDKNDKWCCKQVVVHTVDSKKCYIKDIALFAITGYVVGWYQEGFTRTEKFYENKGWNEEEDKYFQVYPKQVNLDYLLKMDKYKYSAVDQYRYYDTLKYIRLYAKYPQVEFLTKFGFQSLATKKTILQMIGKDKKFRSFLINHKNEICAINSYIYVSTIIYAYKKNMDLKSAQKYEEFYKDLIHSPYYNTIKRVFDGNMELFYKYAKEQKLNYSSYDDYITACEYLGIDLKENKNFMPHNFKRWHDIRIDEMHTKQAELNRKQKQELYDKFGSVAEKYQTLQRQLKDSFITLIAKSPIDLIHEGDILHHCVGSMNYDQKFAREESLIFFVRTKEKPDKPLVTLEYSPSKHKILQCYGKHDTKPSKDILNYVNNIWLPYANRKLKKVVI